MNLHEIQVIGRIGRDATEKLINNRFVVNFSVAVDDGYIDTTTGEVVENTVWYNVDAWYDDKPKLTRHLTKGKFVFVKGKPKSSIYHSKASNRPAIDYSIRAYNIQTSWDKAEVAQEQTEAQPTEQTEGQPAQQTDQVSAATQPGVVTYPEPKAEEKKTDAISAKVKRGQNSKSDVAPQ